MTRSVRTPARVLALVVALTTAALASGVSPALASPAGAETPQTVVVLDSSGSMAEADAGGGQTRMDAAKQAVVALAESAPASAHIGLRTYGDGVDSEAPGSCEDTTLKVPVGQVDRTAITSAVQALAPRGDTPIGTSLRAAAGDLTGSGPRSIVLVSDGEPTCDLDPCVVAQELAAQGVDLRIDVVGFRVGEQARQILRCVADAGGGQYVDAADAGELTAALSTSGKGSFRVYVPEGAGVTGTPTAEGAPTLEEGQYLDTISVGAPRSYRVDYREGETLRVGATITRGDDGSRRGVGGFVIVRTLGPDGKQCVVQLETGGADQGTSPATGALLHGPGSWYDWAEESCRSGLITVEVEWTNASDTGALPLELIIDVEPPVVTAPQPQQAVNQSVDYPEPPRAAGPPRPVTGGGSFNDATELAPGLHSDSMRSGEAVFYRVPLDWGQQLAVRVDFPAQPDGSPIRQDLGAATYAHLDLHSEHRVSVSSVSDGAERLDPVGDEQATIHGTTHPVAYEGRQEWVYGEQWGMSVPGDVFVKVSLGRTASTDESSGVAVPYEISVDVLGDPLEGPVYEGEDRADASADPSAKPTSEPSTAPAAAEPSPQPSSLDTEEVVAAEEPDGRGALTVALVVVAGLLVSSLVALGGWGAARRRGGRDAGRGLS